MTIAEVSQRKTTSATTASSRPPLADQPLGRGRFFAAKEIVDRVLATVLLIPALPLVAVLIAAIRLTSRGPAIYRQVRVGKGKRIFTMYKLRSMRIDAEARTGPTWSVT